ncbi:MAG TPA: hypothetical protein VHE30_08605 [Polyangiaceae bacterium]|nr:hypothetical protein [Polyangiaceae bacterium]
MRRAPVRFVLPMLAALGQSACFAPNDGRPPPEGNIYFPVGLSLGASRANGSARVLYVANSDFDLQYNAGTVQAFDLDVIGALMGDVPQIGTDAECAKLGTGVRAQRPEEQVTAPAPCSPVAADATTNRGKLLLDTAVIGAFATDVLYRTRHLEPPTVTDAGVVLAPPAPDAGPGGETSGRLFVPVRGDTTLHWLDVDESDDAFRTGHILSCGQDADGVCDHDHRRGGDPAEENTRGVQLPAEPYGIAADDDGRVVVTTHQSDGKVSLFVNQWSAGDGYPVGPRLEFVAGGAPTDPLGALAIASIPKPAYLRELQLEGKCTAYQPSFLLTFRNSAQVRLVRYFSDGADPGCHVTGNYGADPARPFLDMTQGVNINTNSVGFDSRGIAVDANRRQECEAKCPVVDPPGPSGARRDCLQKCTYVGLDVFVANRTPATLVIGETQSDLSALGTSDLPLFYENVGLLAGPSRVIAGYVRGPHGPERRIFVVCFDARTIFVWDPVGRRVEAEILTGRGPHAFAVDPVRGLGYVGHFTDSYLGVVDLDLTSKTYGKLRLSIGVPTRPRASK